MKISRQSSISRTYRKTDGDRRLSIGTIQNVLLGKMPDLSSFPQACNFLLSVFMENIMDSTVKALLSPGGAYLFFAVLEGGLNREGGLL